MTRGTVTRFVLFGAILMMVVGCAHTQPRNEAPDSKAPSTSSSQHDEARKQATEIGLQPVRDVGLLKRTFPPVLEDALADPYSTRGLKTCAQLAAAVRTLNEALGPDYRPGGAYRENRFGKLAAAGGKTVINSIIPYRGIVREISGAAPADRHMNAVIEAGLARRGFLRGLQQRQRCKTTP